MRMNVHARALFLCLSDVLWVLVNSEQAAAEAMNGTTLLERARALRMAPEFAATYPKVEDLKELLEK